MKWVTYFVMAVLCVCFAVLGLFNSGDVHFNYILGERDLPLFVVMLICFLFGAILALLVFGLKSLYWRGRARSAERQLEQEYRRAEQDETKRDFDKRHAANPSTSRDLAVSQNA